MHGLLQRVAQLSLQRTRVPGDAGIATCQSLCSLLSHSTIADRFAKSSTPAGGDRSISTAPVSLQEGCKSVSSPAGSDGCRGGEGSGAASTARQPPAVSAAAAGFRGLSLAAGSQLAGVSQQHSGLHSSAHAGAPEAGDAATPAGDQPPAPAAAERQAPPPPWTPTKLLAKRKTLPKRMGHMLQVLLAQIL